jgi:hypothetical protein
MPKGKVGSGRAGAQVTTQHGMCKGCDETIPCLDSCTQVALQRHHLHVWLLLPRGQSVRGWRRMVQCNARHVGTPAVSRPCMVLPLFMAAALLTSGGRAQAWCSCRPLGGVFIQLLPEKPHMVDAPARKTSHAVCKAPGVVQLPLLGWRV